MFLYSHQIIGACVHGFHNSTILTENDFLSGLVMDEENNVDGRWFIKFYAPWCGHCKRLAPVWEELADMVYSQGYDFKIGSVDCTQQRMACDRVDISGYPSLYVFEGTEAYQFRNKREIDQLAAFISNDAYKQYGEKQKIIRYEEIPKTSFGKALNEITKSLGEIFTSMGLDFIPPVGQVLIAISVC